MTIASLHKKTLWIHRKANHIFSCSELLFNFIFCSDCVFDTLCVWVNRTRAYFTQIWRTPIYWQLQFKCLLWIYAYTLTSHIHKQKYGNTSFFVRLELKAKQNIESRTTNFTPIAVVLHGMCHYYSHVAVYARDLSTVSHILPAAHHNSPQNSKQFLYYYCAEIVIMYFVVIVEN